LAAAGRLPINPVMAMDAENEETLRLLAEHRAGGEYVCHAARMVGDEEDHAIWRQSRYAWSAAASATVAARIPDEGERFRRACEPPKHSAGWKRQYESELSTVTAGLRLLTSYTEAIEMRSSTRRLAGVA